MSNSLTGGLSVDEWLDRKMKQRQDAQEVHCPHCNKTQDDLYEIEGLVTYHGEDGWIKMNCQSCDKEFEAEESVYRTYETRKIESKR